MPKKAENEWEYVGNSEPRCPHCDRDIHIEENDLHILYGDDAHEIYCPHCEKEIVVITAVSHSFETKRPGE